MPKCSEEVNLLYYLKSNNRTGSEDTHSVQENLSKKFPRNFSKSIPYTDLQIVTAYLASQLIS